MNVEDQLSVLAMASTMSMTLEHAFFSFAQSPYDRSNDSLLGVKASVLLEPRFFNDTLVKNVNIFENLFLIDVSFPGGGTINNSMAVTGRRKRNINTIYSGNQKSSIDVFDMLAVKKDGGHSLTVVSETAMGNGQLTSNTQSDVDVVNVDRLEHALKPTQKPEIFPHDTIFDFVNILTTDDSRSGYKVSDSTTPKTDYVSPPQPRSSAKSYDVIKKHSPQFTNQRAEHQSKFNFTNTLPKLPERIHSLQTGSPKQQTLALLFESEGIISKSKPDTSIDVLKHTSSNLVAKFRTKRDIETFRASEADLLAVYDTVLLVAYAAYIYIQQSNSVPSSNDLITALTNLTFPGFSGQFSLDSQQRVSYDFSVYDFNVTSGSLERRIYYQTVTSESWTLKEQQHISWPAGVMLASDDCFKEDPDCNEGLKSSILAAIVISAVILVVAVTVVVVVFRRYWVNKEMTKGPNKVILCSEDLVFVLRKNVGKGSRIMKSRVTLLDKDNAPDLIRGSDPNRSMASINELSDYTETARYNGDLVHVKELDIKGFEMKSKLLTFVRLCRDLRHENLNPYAGFLADTIRPAIVMEYCSRGSLYDIIHNEDFKLDWDFKLSLLTDLVRGVRYLHSSALKFHGHMTSKNCVIDSRFVLKITDYGVSGIMERCKAFKVFDTKDLLWSAPELLRDEALLQRGTDKGDIYAISIIFQEVALRTEPFSTSGLSPEEIVKKLKKPPPLIRPSVTPQAAPPLFIQVMKQCWSEMPEMRPNIDDVYDQFKKLTGGKKANIVDTMFKMLEKYSTDLEDIVAERTMQLEEEKKKTDQLLFRMLPPTVAESLKIGKTVQAECFDEVTIYFSDIVGFTTISAMSTPMQVVDLLNDLYSMFDATINDHDVYKVETIGDAYMVVSGLPIRNGNRHAGEIGTLALVLLSQCGKFTIRHMAHVPLRLRIGLHTGSCVAGVVGMTMPRFCLFGDTVNTASRMESSGAAFRVHISEACKLVLDALGGYMVEYRGQTELKGKGLHNTYWLTGKEGFDKVLPEPPPMKGLDSILGDVKIDFKGGLDPPKNDAINKSNSVPNLTTPSTIPKANDEHASSKNNRTATSHPSNLDETHRNNCRQSKSSNTSVVTADINIHGGGATSELTHKTANQNSGNKPEAGKSPYQSHHSESNDSGFGSERKHSQGNDGGYIAVNCGKTSDHYKRGSQISNNRASVTSSSDLSLQNSLLPSVDIGEELAPVTEV